MKKSALMLKNVLYGVGTRLIILALGLTLPRLIMVSFGSEINGLLATLTQIFAYLALLEAGIGNSAVNALYKPLDEGNYSEINEVLAEARTYYRKVSFVYGTCVIAFAVLFPLFIDTSLNRMTVFGMIILQGSGSFVNYYFSAVYTQLLTADGKRYVNENISFITYVLTSVIKILLIIQGFGVLTVQCAFFVISILKAPVLAIYCRKKYPWMAFNTKTSVKRLQERSAFVIHELSGTIFNNTDVFVVSAFCSLELASVYTVYNLVYSSLNTLLSTVNGGLGFLLGQGQYKGRERFMKIYDMYSVAYSYASFVLFTTAEVLIIPFVKLYTSGVRDTDYLLAGLPVLFTVVNLMSAIRATGSLLINVSGHAEKTKNRSMLEAVINLGSSLLLVNLFGIKGVLYGTILALLYRSNDIIIYANRKILNRSPWREYRNVIINSIIFVIICICSQNVKIEISNYPAFILYAVLVMIIIMVIYLFAAVVFNLKLFQYWGTDLFDSKRLHS